VPLVLNEVLLRPYFPETHNLIADWYLFNLYLLLTLYGFLLASMAQAWEWLAAQRRFSSMGALATGATSIVLLSSGVMRHGSAADAVVASAFTWLGVMALLGYGRHYLSHGNRWLQWARDASYPIYILHQTVIVALGYYVVQQGWPAWVKFAVVAASTLIGCSLIYEYLIRRWGVLRLVFGMKPQAAPRPGQVTEIAPST
jgi:peptidoglycan/LPS O-acetylase OafA/YrhL